jgi:hypothetical protein
MPLIAATTVVLNPQDSSLVTYGITDNYGKFLLSNLPPGAYLLQITYIGYGTFQQQITARGSAQLIDLGNISLSIDNELLEIIVVKSEHVPLVIKGDTVEYNAAAFKTRKSDAVEDLLMKLPGVEVEQDGNIKVQGKDVDRVLVDGKEFFGDDHRIATKNLPADVVDKVAVYDRKSEESEFTGIDDGERNKTINLKLKEDKKHGSFGKVEAGYGSDNRYTGKFQLNRFSSNTQTSIISNLNNVNNVGFSVANGSSFGEQTITIGGGSSLGLAGRGSTPGENTTGSAGLNLNHDFTKNLKWRSSYLFNYADQNVAETNRSTYFLNDLNYTNAQKNSNEFNQKGHNLNTSLEYDMDSTSELRIKSQFNYNDSETNILSSSLNLDAFESPISGLEREGQTEANVLGIDIDAAFRKRLAKKGRILQMSGGINNQDNDDDLFINNLLNEPSQITQIIQDQIERENQKSFRTGISYTEPLSEKLLWNFSASVNMTSHDQINDFFNIDPVFGDPVIDNLLSNVYEKNYNFQNYGSSIRFIASGFNILAGLNYYNANLSGRLEETLVNDEDYSFMLPNMNIGYELRNGRVGLEYRTIVREPSLYQLQPVVDNRNPLFLYNGNPNLKPAYNHLLNLNFNTYDGFNFRSWFGFLAITYTKDYISTSRIVDQNLATTLMPTNVNDNLTLNSRLSYSTPIGWAKAKMRISASGNMARTTTLINDIENDNNRKGGGMSLSLENKVKDNFSLRISGGIDITDSKFSQNDEFNVVYTNTNIGGVLELYLSERISFDADFRMDNYSQEQFSTDNRLFFWNASLSKTFGENERLTLIIEGKDLLDTNAGISRSANAGVISEVNSSNLGRYFILKASYSLSAFKPKSMFSIH